MSCGKNGGIPPRTHSYKALPAGVVCEELVCRLLLQGPYRLLLCRMTAPSHLDEAIFAVPFLPSPHA